MAKIESDGKLPKRIGDYVIYDSKKGEKKKEKIMKKKSGFTSKALLESPKYELCRHNALEFGRISTLCKALRLSLYAVLPKKNNLAVVNSLAKKMRGVIVYDTILPRGARILDNALATEAGRQYLKGYHFNPDGAVDLGYVLEGQRLHLTTNAIVFPEGASSVGCTVLSLAFDFITAESQLAEGDTCFFNKQTLPNVLELGVPALEQNNGVLFTILALHFYHEEQGSYVPLEDDRSVVVMVV